MTTGGLGLFLDPGGLPLGRFELGVMRPCWAWSVMGSRGMMQKTAAPVEDGGGGLLLEREAGYPLRPPLLPPESVAKLPGLWPEELSSSEDWESWEREAAWVLSAIVGGCYDGRE